ncbi:tetratricopeptide repeat protein, partial [Candidatus Neomarinimicrobiota bacterium]
LVSSAERKEAQKYFKEAQDRLGQDDFEEAARCFEEAVRLHPGYVAAHNDVGALYLSRGEAHRALVHLEIASSIAPDNSQVRWNLIETYVAVGRMEDAVKTCQTLVDYYPEDQEALYWLAMASTRLGSPDLTRKFAARVLTLNSEHVDAKALLDSLSTPS